MRFLLAVTASLVVNLLFNVELAGAQTGVIEPDRAQPELPDTHHPALPQFTMQERASIYAAVMTAMKESPATPVPVDMQVRIGTKLLDTAQVRPLPDAVRKISAAKNYKCAVWGSQVLLVDPTNMTVVDMLHDYILRDYIPHK